MGLIMTIFALQRKRLFNNKVNTKKKKRVLKERFLTTLFVHLDPAVLETLPLYI